MLWAIDAGGSKRRSQATRLIPGGRLVEDEGRLELPRRVADLQRRRGRGLALEVEVDQGPVGRVLALEEEVAAAVAAALDAEPARARLAGFEQGGVLSQDRVGCLAQAGDVVQDPDAAAVRRRDQVVVAGVDEQVVDRDRGQVEPERRPALAAVAAEEDAELGAQEEQVLGLEVLADDVDRLAVGDAGRDRGPGLAVVRRLEDVDVEVVGAVAVEGHIAGALVEVGGLDPAAPQPGRHALDGRPDVGPGHAAVAGQLDVAVVRPDPDQAGGQGRLGDGDDRAVRLGAGDVGGHAAGRLGRGVLALVVGRQVGADDHPMIAPVERPEEVVAAEVDRARVVRREDDGRAPVEAEDAAAAAALDWAAVWGSTAPPRAAVCGLACGLGGLGPALRGRGLGRRVGEVVLVVDDVLALGRMLRDSRVSTLTRWIAPPWLSP